ncbi:heme oxygenase (biliverdin-producing) [Leptolyngbya sp. PCC 6406]|uniref:biliverdin-producing heme oxygenase n=1 Tax=Leptolyngbya sp. PCC 6406 TaxID=1173264 RepID=UPI0002ACAE86|nr:biliverdin-producing heme oxygenase [Leptolyngbya sp. PCC 6406]
MTDLAQQLRLGTQQAHTTAENSLFMKCFLDGIVVESTFRKLLSNLYWVYRTLETAMEEYRDHPIVGPMVFPEIQRTAKLQEDLQFYYGEAWRDAIGPEITPAGQVYVTRLQQVTRENPALLVPHSYVRYLGDLSGGQGLKGIVRKALNPPPDQGTGLHEFDLLPTPEAKQTFKERYRAALNQLPVDEVLAEQMVLEAQRAFHLNCAVMASLDGEMVLALEPATLQRLQDAHRPGSTQGAPAMAS